MHFICRYLTSIDFIRNYQFSSEYIHTLDFNTSEYKAVLSEYYAALREKKIKM